MVAVDNAVPELIVQLKAAGMPAIGAKGKILDGIGMIRDRLGVQKDGRPRYTVDPSCVEHINEFESYIHKPDSDVPQKEFDHSLDALRYLNDALAEPKGSFKSTEGIRVGSDHHNIFIPDILTAEDLGLNLE
jgi:phage terminase large subunit